MWTFAYALILNEPVGSLGAGVPGYLARARHATPLGQVDNEATHPPPITKETGDTPLGDASSPDVNIMTNAGIETGSGFAEPFKRSLSSKTLKAILRLSGRPLGLRLTDPSPHHVCP